MLNKGVKIVLGILGILNLSYFTAGYYFSGQIVKPKVKTLTEDKTILKLPELQELALPKPKEIAFASQGLTHRGWLFQGQRKDCGLIVHHGFTATRWGAIPYARHFSRCQILVYDAQGHGESDPALCTYGAKEHKTLLDAVAFLQKTTNLAKRQIGLIGESMGGAVILLAAAKEPGFAFLVVDSAFATLEDIVRERAIALYGKALLPLFPAARFFAEWRASFSFEEVRAVQAASHIQDPLFVVHSEQDEHTAVSHSQRIFEAASTKAKELFITTWGASHARSIHTNPEAYLRRLKAFISRYAPDYPGLW